MTKTQQEQQQTQLYKDVAGAAWGPYGVFYVGDVGGWTEFDITPLAAWLGQNNRRLWNEETVCGSCTTLSSRLINERRRRSTDSKHLKSLPIRSSRQSARDSAHIHSNVLPAWTRTPWYIT